MSASDPIVIEETRTATSAAHHRHGWFMLHLSRHRDRLPTHMLVRAADAHARLCRDFAGSGAQPYSQDWMLFHLRSLQFYLAVGKAAHPY